MTSTSDSDYLSHCRAFLAPMKRRPRMFFSSLPELETMMHGHSVAFLQLGLIPDESAAFNYRFRDWLLDREKCSTASGWALAVENLAAQQVGVSAVTLFFDLVTEFLESVD